MKNSSGFLYYYLFPFDLNYERYFHFVLIGTKKKTVNEYFDEINKIINDFFSMYSEQDYSIISSAIKDIKKTLLENENIIIKKEIINNMKEIKKEEIDNSNKEKKEEQNENKDNNDDLKELLDEMPEEIRDSIEKQIEKDNNKNESEQKGKYAKKEEKSKDITDNKNIDDNKNNENNNKSKNDELIINENKNDSNNELDIQFIMELPMDLREEILSTLDQSMIKQLSPELQNEYNRIMNRNNRVIILNVPSGDNYNNDQMNNDNSENNDNSSIQLNKKKEISLKKVKYKREDILSNYNSLNDDNNLWIKIFEDEFIENLIIFNIKSILTFRKKNKNSFN
jgi:hypothetical protein